MKKNNSHPSTESNRTTGSHNLGRLILQLRRLERQPRAFGQGGPLTPSEIHTIDAIGCEGGVLMSALAKRLGVTKGAVTQMVARLESRDLVRRTTHPDDFRAVMVSLTEKGESAFLAHQELHENFYQELYAQFDRTEIEIFEKCIEKLVRYLQP